MILPELEQEQELYLIKKTIRFWQNWNQNLV